MATTRAGFAATDITPAVGQAVPGGFAPRASTGVLHPLQARACVVAGEPETVAIVGVDAVSLRFDTVRKAWEQIEAVCGIPAQRRAGCKPHALRRPIQRRAGHGL